MEMKTKLLIFLFIFATTGAFAQAEGFEERILAVVDNRIITSGEAEVALMMETGELPEDSALYYDLLSAKVEDLVDEELILIAAEEESLEIDESRIDEMFNSRWGILTEGYGGEAALENALEAEGYTVDEFRSKTRRQIESFYLKQMYIEKHFGRVQVTESEVDSFFEVFRDSLPAAPTEIELLSIIVNLKPDTASLNRALNILNNAKDRIDAGEDFATVAAEISEDQLTAPVGGQLGTYNRGDLTQALDSIAFSLTYDEIGGPVQSPMGFHLIKVIDKAGGKVTLAHILAKAPLSDDRSMRLIALADSIYTDATAESGDFAGLVEKFNFENIIEFEDYGWVPLAAIQGESGKDLAGANEGAILGPYEIGDYIQIIKVAGKREGRQRSLDEDRELIREATRQMKTREAIETRLNKLRDKYYIEIRI